LRRATLPRNLVGHEFHEFGQSMSIGNDCPWRRIALDMKIFQVTLKQLVLFWARHSSKSTLSVLYQKAEKQPAMLSFVGE
jgi:hypothetical protein